MNDGARELLLAGSLLRNTVCAHTICSYTTAHLWFTPCSFIVDTITHQVAVVMDTDNSKLKVWSKWRSFSEDQVQYALSDNYEWLTCILYYVVGILPAFCFLEFGNSTFLNKGSCVGKKQTNDKVRPGHRICFFSWCSCSPLTFLLSLFFFLIPLCNTLVSHTCPSPLELIGVALFLQLHPSAPDWLPTAQQASLGPLSNQGQAGEKQAQAAFPSHFRIE